MTAKIAVTASIVCAPRRLSAWGGISFANLQIHQIRNKSIIVHQRKKYEAKHFA